jgi:exodeoxyribonuclease VII large subunit
MDPSPFSPHTVTDFQDEAPLSVSELVGYISGTLEREFSQILVTGELTACNRAASGHVYFSLSDASACVDGVIWRSDAFRLAFQPKAGDEVVVRGRMGVFARSGRMQLYATAMKPIGAGAAQRALEALKQKLAAEGLFAAERKRPLPFLPATIGIVTSRSGAALHDILVTLRRRWPGVHVVLSPSVVQGAEAPRSIVAALARLEAWGGCDVVIVGRGGGAAEDLAAFNDERVVRAVAAFPVPVVSAVGHEVDVSLCDLAADLRAATPTGAAESLVPVRSEVVGDVAMTAHRLRTAILRRMAELRMHVENRASLLRHPSARVAELRQRADRAMMQLERALAARVADPKRRLSELAAALDALSPLAVLERGYSLATVAAAGSDDLSGRRLVRDAAELAEGDRVELRFHRGRAGAEIVWRELAEPGKSGTVSREPASGEHPDAAPAEPAGRSSPSPPYGSKKE